MPLKRKAALLKSSRLTFRPLLDGDQKDLMKIFSDPICMHFYKGCKTLQEADEWVKKARDFYKRMKIGFFYCALQKTNEFVGICGLLQQKDVDGRDEIELGYLFVPEYWRKGLATEAAKTCMDYGFHTLGFKRIISLIDPENIASIRVAEKNGLHKEKTITYKERKASVYALEL